MSDVFDPPPPERPLVVNEPLHDDEHWLVNRVLAGFVVCLMIGFFVGFAIGVLV